jgi:hypothetical protein
VSISASLGPIDVARISLPLSVSVSALLYLLSFSTISLKLVPLFLSAYIQTGNALSLSFDYKAHE